MTDGRLAGKTAIVTGGARGSGAAIARRFVDEGAHVVVADVLDERGGATVTELGAGARYVHADVSSEDDWNVLITATLDTHGRLDVLVNNAAVLRLCAIADTSVDQYRKIFEVNELGVFLGIRAADHANPRGGRGIDRQHFVDRRSVRHARHGHVHGEQRRRPRAHETATLRNSGATGFE